MAAAFPDENEEKERIYVVCITAEDERMYKRIVRAIFVDDRQTLEQALNDMEAPGYVMESGYSFLLNIQEKIFHRQHPFPDIGQFDDPIIQGRVWNVMQRLLSRTAKLKEIEQLPDQKAKVMAATAYYRGLLLHLAVAHGDIVKVKWISRISDPIPDACAYDNCQRLPREVAMLDPPKYKVNRSLAIRGHEHWPICLPVPPNVVVKNPAVISRAARSEEEDEKERLLWNNMVTSRGLTRYLLQKRDMLNPERVMRFEEMVEPHTVLCFTNQIPDHLLFQGRSFCDILSMIS